MSFNFIYNSIDPKELETEFLKTYYQNMINLGLSANLGLFDEKCNCLINNQEFIGAYNILVKMAQQNIHKYQYKYLQGNLQKTQNGFIITVSGICQPVNFQNLHYGDLHFSEVFYLSNQYPYKIINYISHYF